MKSAFIRAAMVIAVGIAMIAPLKVSADPLTKPQLAQVASMSKAYFAAVATGDWDTINPLVTPGFVVIGLNGKPVPPKTLAAAMAKLGGASNAYNGKVSLDKASVVGKTVTANVSVDAFNTSPAGLDSSFPISSRAKHTLTYVQGADGKWLISKDQVNSRIVQH
jgi:Domain of unknown function (DUF4440)